MTWLARTPLCVIAAHLEMMRRIQAAENMRDVTVTAMSGSVEMGEWVTQQWHSWDLVSGNAAKPQKGQLPDNIGIGKKRVKHVG